MKSDAELLRDYRRRGDERAFCLLVERYAGMVQGAALRRTGDVELAREAAQQVFVLLAKNAGRLYTGTGLAGWLHRTAVLVASNIRRREVRRGRVMKCYEDHVQLTGMPGEEIWAEAVPLVDEGLTRLPEEEQQILLAHFWQGLTYQEIAAARSSTEAAVQRKASRAFVKLGWWLGKRRVAVSGGVLTAGLGTLPQQASAAHFAAAGPLAARVLADLPAASLPSLWTWRIREMLAFGKVNFAGGLLMGALVALLGGVGFSRGRLLAWEEQAQRQFASDVRAAKVALAGLPAVQPPAGTAGRLSLAELIAAAAEHYRHESDPAGEARGQLLLEQVRPDEIPEAMALLEGALPEEAIGRRMVPHLLSRWRVGIKADAALGWVLEKIRDEEALRACLTPAMGAWASRDPAAAREWWLAHPELHQRADGYGIHHAILMSYNPVQLETLWPRLHLMEDDEFQATANFFTLRVKDPAGRAELYTRICAVPDGRVRASLFSRAGSNLARYDPEAAVAWTKDLPLADPKEAFRVRADVGHDLLRSSPVLAARVFMQNPPGPLRDLFMEGFQKSLSKNSK